MQTPQVPKDIIDIIRGLEQRIRELEKGAPIRNAQISGGQGLTVTSPAGVTVTGGGGVTIGAGGSLRVEDPDGGSNLFSIRGTACRSAVGRVAGSTHVGHRERARRPAGLLRPAIGVIPAPDDRRGKFLT